MTNTHTHTHTNTDTAPAALRFGVELETQSYAGMPYSAPEEDCDQITQEDYRDNQVISDIEERQRRAESLLPYYEETVRYWYNTLKNRNVSEYETEVEYTAAGVELPQYLPWFLISGTNYLCDDYEEWYAKDTEEKLDIVISLLEDYSYELKRDCSLFFQNGSTDSYFATRAHTCMVENVMECSEIPERVYDTLPESRMSSECFERDGVAPDGWLGEHDGSVTGPEFKFDGPASYEESKRLLQSMKWSACEIDTQCSFHIHVSEVAPTLPESVWNKAEGWSARRALRHFAMEYIIGRRDTFPTSLKRRLGSSARKAFASIAQETTWTRYTCVNFCEKYQTLEFRIFGNIASEVDGMYCLDLARDAFNHAVSRYNNGERAPTNFVGTWQEWENLWA